MTCRYCGHENRSSARHCEQCGARFLSRQDEDLGSLPLSRTNRRQYTARDEQAADFRREEAANERYAQRIQRRNAKLSRSERELYGMKHKKRTSAERSAAVFRIMLLCVLVIVALVAVAWGISQIWPEGEPPSGNSTESYTPDITADEDKDGNPVHILTFYGEQGDIIYIPELQKNYTIESNNVRITIPDSTFISDDPQAATATVELHPVLYPLGKKSRELDTVLYTVDVPLSPLALLQPESGHGKTYQSFYLIKIQVQPGSDVWIDGSDVTDLIDADNVISHNVEVNPVGDNIISITVSTPGYRTYMEQVVIERPYMDIPIEINVNAPVSSTSSSVTLTGKTTAGAALQVSPSAESVTVGDNGDFTIKIKMTKYGENAYIITATMPGKEDSSIDHTIIYSPNLDEYSRSAWQMDYDHVRVNQSSFQGRIFMCPGKIVETLSENPYIFTFNVGTDEKPQLIVIEMIKDNPFELNPDKKYDVYADLEGTYEGYLRFNGRFFLESATK